MAFLSGGGERRSQGSDEVARVKVRVSALERGVTDLRGGLDEMLAQLADMRAAATAAHPQQPPRETETSPPQHSNTDSPPAAQAPLSADNLRKIVREEIRRYHEERRKQHEPEEWEKKEFGNKAWIVHRIGAKLGLSKEQKRAYFQILKRFVKQVRELWSRMISETGDRYEVEKRMEAERKRLLEEAREEVESLLTPQQRTKYRELIKNDRLFRRWFP